jgi:hypothetical protein
VYHGEIVDGALFVSPGDPAELFQPVDQALDPVAPAISLAVKGGILPLVALGRD